MFRILLFVLLLIIVLIAVWFPRFRKVMVFTLFGILLAIGLIIWQDTRERDLEKQRVLPSEVELSHMVVSPGLNSRSFLVNGRLQNGSTHATVVSAVLQVTLEDCHGDDGMECEFIGQEQAEINLEIPIGQSRDFKVSIPFSTVPRIQGHARWHYQIIQVRAR